MEFILYASIYTIFSIGMFIVYAFLKEVGFWTYLYEAAYTHSKFDTIMRIIGDALYGIGLSVLASVGFTYLTAGTIAIKAIVYGIIVVIMGATWKEKFKG